MYSNSNELKPRLRVQKACDSCKQRKVKCDGMNPCLNCVKHTTTCNYNFSLTKPRGKYKKVLKKETTPDNRIDKAVYLEDQTAKLLLQLSSKHNSSTNLNSLPNENTIPGAAVSNVVTLIGNNVSPVGSPYNSYRVSGTHQEDTRFNSEFNNSDVELKNSSPWFHYSREKYRFHRRYQNLLPYFFGSTLISQLPQEIIEQHNLEVPRIQNYGWNMAGGHYVKLTAKQYPNIFKEVIDFDNPVHISTVVKLLTYYFNNVNKTFSIVHESVFWQQFNNGFLQQRKTKTKSTKLFISMLYLMISTALRFYDGEIQNEAEPSIPFTIEELQFLKENDSILEENLFNYSYAMVSKLTFEWESFELIQSWLLMAFYLRTCYRQIACWNALSKAITLCKGMSLNLNQLPEVHPPTDASKAWHCFWLCFVSDKLMSFQVGRKYQLELPIVSMKTPLELYKFISPNNTNNYDWFNSETIQMYKLSLFVLEYQKPNADELTVDETIILREKLNKWLDEYLAGNSYESLMDWDKPQKIQPLMTFFDIFLTFESKSLLTLLNPPNDIKESLNFDVDIDGVIAKCELSILLLESIFSKNKYFIPWWLNLSLLFCVSIINIILVHSGLRHPYSKHNLDKCMRLWEALEAKFTKNPPVMLRQCVWCLKSLNYMICLRLINSVGILKDIVGVNFSDNTPNKNVFHQFSQEGEDNGTEEHTKEKKTLGLQDSQLNGVNLINNNINSIGGNISKLEYPTEAIFSNTMNSTPSDLLDEDLFGNLQWFDQNFM